MGEPIGDLTGLALGLLLLERVDEFDGGEEANALAMMLDRLHAEGGGDVGLAGARAATPLSRTVASEATSTSCRVRIFSSRRVPFSSSA